MHPEFALLKWPNIGRRLDVGQLCYLIRDTSNTHRKYHTFDPESLSVERMHTVRTLIALLSERTTLGAFRHLTVLDYGRVVVQFVNWSDRKKHHRCLCSKRETEEALELYVAELRELIAQGKIHHNTVSTRQRILLPIFQTFFEDEEFGLGFQSVRFRRSHVVPTQVPTSERQSRLLAWSEVVFAEISTHILQSKPYPFSIRGAEEKTVWILPNQHGGRRNGKTKGVLGWNLETGQLVPYKDLKQKFQNQGNRYYQQLAYSVARSAKRQLEVANADARGPVRLGHAATAAYAFGLLFLAETGINLSQLLAMKWSTELEQAVQAPFVVRQKFREVKYRARGAEFAFKVSIGFMPKLKIFLALRKYIIQKKKVHQLFIGAGTTSGLGWQFLTQLYKRLETLGITLPRLNAREWRAAKQDWATTNHGPVVAASLLGHSLDTALRSYSNGTDATQRSEIGAFFTAVEDVVLPARQAASDGINSAVGICRNFKKPGSITSFSAVKPDCQSSEGCLFCKQYRIHADAIDIRKLLSCRYCLRITHGLAVSLEQYESSFGEVFKRVQFLLDELKSRNRSLVETIEHDVDVLGNLDAFWSSKLEQLFQLGLV
jgi:hypothetical protein